MRNLIVKVTIVTGLSLALTATIYSAKREKDDQRADKTGVTEKQPNVTTKTLPATTPTPTIQPVSTDTTTPAVQPVSTNTTTTRAGEQVKWQMIASGGGLSILGSMTLGSTVGQTVAGQSTMGDYVLNSGFQQNFEADGETCCIPPMRGDVNYDGAELIDISDLFYLIDYMFTAGPAPVCFEEADIDASGSEPIDISDLIYLIDYMFRGGPPPSACP